MAKAKTSKNLKKLPKKSTKKSRLDLFQDFSPSNELANDPALLLKALSEALLDGDKETFQEILESYVKAKNILEVSRQTKLSRTTIYDAIDKRKNPGLATICKIMSAFSKVS